MIWLIKRVLSSIFRNIGSNFHTTKCFFLLSKNWSKNWGEKEESEEWLHESWSTRHHHQVEELHDSIVHGTQVNRILMTKQYQPAVIEWTPTVMH